MKRLLELLLSYTLDTQAVSSVICRTTCEMDSVLAEVGNVDFGLCAIIEKMYNTHQISYNDKVKLNAYLIKHRPKTLVSDLTLNNLVSQQRFYWLPGNWKSRLAWINKHINLNK